MFIICNNFKNNNKVGSDTFKKKLQIQSFTILYFSTLRNLYFVLLCMVLIWNFSKKKKSLKVLISLLNLIKKMYTQYQENVFLFFFR